MDNRRLLMISIFAGLGLVLLLATVLFVARRPVPRLPTTQAESAPVSSNATTGANNTPTIPATAAVDYQIISVLPQDAIPAIDTPEFYSAQEAEREYAPEELVLGVTIEGESRAYSTGLLDRHEIVNDTLGGREIAVTW